MKREIAELLRADNNLLTESERKLKRKLSIAFVTTSAVMLGGCGLFAFTVRRMLPRSWLPVSFGGLIFTTLITFETIAGEKGLAREKVRVFYDHQPSEAD